jgi:SSS family solute:Na+ symporter
LAGVALGLATALTASGLPIVDTMVSVNVVYIASVGVSLVGLLRGTEARGVDDTWVIAAGFAAAVAVYLAAGLGVPIPNVELVALVAGLATATAARVALRRRERDLACEPANR